MFGKPKNETQVLYQAAERAIHALNISEDSPLRRQIVDQTARQTLDRLRAKNPTLDDKALLQLAIQELRAE